MVLLVILLWGSVWLVRNAPKAVSGPVVAKISHEPDYFANNFTLKTYSLQGVLKSFLQGKSTLHFPDPFTCLLYTIYASDQSREVQPVLLHW